MGLSWPSSKLVSDNIGSGLFLGLLCLFFGLRLTDYRESMSLNVKSWRLCLIRGRGWPRGEEAGCVDVCRFKIKMGCQRADFFLFMVDLVY